MLFLNPKSLTSKSIVAVAVVLLDPVCLLSSDPAPSPKGRRPTTAGFGGGDKERRMCTAYPDAYPARPATSYTSHCTSRCC